MQRLVVLSATLTRRPLSLISNRARTAFRLSPHSTTSTLSNLNSSGLHVDLLVPAEQKTLARMIHTSSNNNARKCTSTGIKAAFTAMDVAFASKAGIRNISSATGHTNESAAEPTIAQAIHGDKGLARHLKQVYSVTATGLLFWSGTMATLIMFKPAALFLAMHPFIVLFSGLGVSLFGSYKVLSTPTLVRRVNNMLVNIDSPSRRRAALATFIGFGAMTAPMVSLFAASGAASAIPVAFVSTMGVMGGAAMYARTKRDDELTVMGPALYGGLMGLVGVGLLNLFVQSPLLMKASGVVSIGVFAALTAYDTAIVTSSYRNGAPDVLAGAINYFMNFANIFQNMLMLLGFDNIANTAGSAASIGGNATGNAAAGAAGAGGLDADFTGANGDDALPDDSIFDDLPEDSSGILDSIFDGISGVWNWIRQFYD